MLTYNDIYEFLRKEKYGEQLQNLPVDFVNQFSNYMVDKRKQFSDSGEDVFAENLLKEKRQYENAMTIFKEMILRRKKKILEMVFVAAETGVMRDDFSDMLSFEKDLFEKLIIAVEESDKSLSELMNGKGMEINGKKILVKESVEEFVGSGGEKIGPYEKGAVVDLDSQVAEILVSNGRASFIDEE